MDFAKSQLEKYGWSEGKGLGRDELGMKDAIKVKFKFDTTGVGHNPADQFTYHWWSHAFDQAAKNIKVDHSEEGVLVNSSNTHALSTRKPLSKHLAGKSLLYGRFVKSATLLNGCLEGESSASSSDSEDGDGDADNRFKQVTDEDMFKLCEGRTAHKGARHGITASAKLSRIEQQEAAFMAKWASPAEATGKTNSKTHKIAKSVKDLEDPPSPVQSDADKKSKNRKKHKDKKCQDLVEDKPSNSRGYSSDPSKAVGVVKDLSDEESSTQTKKAKKKKMKKHIDVESIDTGVGTDKKKRRKEESLALSDCEPVQKVKRKKKKSKDREECGGTEENGLEAEEDIQANKKRKRKQKERDCDETTSFIEGTQNESSKAKKRKKNKSKKN